MISRRTLLTLPLVSALGACRSASTPFRGYAFIANQEGEAVAALDLEVMAVAKHIPLQGAPSQVLAAQTRPAVYVLTPDNGTLHQISPDTLRVTGQLEIASRAHSMTLSRDEKTLYVTALEPRSLIAVSVETWRVAWKLRLPEDPVSFALSSDSNTGKDLNTAAVSLGGSVRLIDLARRGLGNPLGGSEESSQTWGTVRFLSSGASLVAANLEARQLSVYRTEEAEIGRAQLITHLPVAVRPDHLCFNQDGGQLFVTGAGMDAVVVVYPYDTPRVAETVLAGHALGVMAVSRSLLFVASPQSGDISILNIPTRKVIAVTQVGSDPGFILVTPDDEYALVLNRESGDVAVLRVAAIQPNRYKSAALLTVVPVGSRPVSAALRAVS